MTTAAGSIIALVLLLDDPSNYHGLSPTPTSATCSVPDRPPIHTAERETLAKNSSQADPMQVTAARVVYLVKIK